MKKSVVYWGICVVVYILYFQVLKCIGDRFMPLNRIANIITLWIFVIVNIPLSVITTEKIFKIIRDE